DLDLLVTSPDGTIYRGNVFNDGISLPGGSADELNVVEQVFMPTVQAGDYTVTVTGYNIPFGPQPFAVVVTGAVGFSSSGFIDLDKSRYNDKNIIQIQVADRDLNVNSSVAEEVNIFINSTSEPGGEVVQLVENESNSSTFIGFIPTRHGPAVVNNGYLEIAEGDTITATYLDKDDGTGNPVTATVTALADLIPPIISRVTNDSIGQDSAMVSWTTNEPVSSTINYGETPDNLGAFQADSGLLTSPVVHLGNLKESTTYYFMVSSTDEAGNKSQDDNNNLLYSFTTLSLPPDLTVFSSNLTETYGTETVLYGTALDPSGIESVRITGNNLDQVVECRPSDGYYELLVPLVIGENPFTVVATDTLDNFHTLHITVTRFEQPDLAITSVVAPAYGGFFQPIHIENTVCNNGIGVSPGTGWIAWYLSPEADISPSEDIQLKLEYYYEDEIPPGECISIPVDIALAIPGSLIGETYYLAAYVDRWGDVWESDETNNILLAGNQVTIEGSDLAMTALSGPQNAQSGTSFTVSNTVENIGLGTSGMFEVVIYLSSDSVITRKDIKIGDRLIHSLQPVGTPYWWFPSKSSDDTEVFVSSEVPDGKYYLGAIASLGSTPEPDIENNVILGKQIVIGEPDYAPPTVPQNLIGTALSFDRIKLSWNAATDNGGTGVVGYWIFRNSDAIGTSTTTTYEDQGLNAETSYIYSVAAYDNSGNLSRQSATVEITTNPVSNINNLPPSISGSPPQIVAADRMYNFVPYASDPDGDNMSFSITNKPGWAQFSETTGKLYGVPGAENIGIYGPIILSVQDAKSAGATLPAFSIQVVPSSEINKYGALPAIYLLLRK
ncbi:MAG: hypothetical protein OEM01_08670, partial [Desulfobulbaceae bacterium]|nr:hypothetical protein [Desulfobulbaceae bacterium]